MEAMRTTVWLRVSVRRATRVHYTRRGPASAEVPGARSRRAARCLSQASTSCRWILPHRAASPLATSALTRPPSWRYLVVRGEGSKMDVKALKDTPPWEWPEGAGKMFLDILRDGQAAESDP